MIKYGITVKGISHYNKNPKINFSKEQYEFFDGFILSDGSLSGGLKSDGRFRNYYISAAFRHKEFAEYILLSLGLKNNVHRKVHKSNRYKGGRCVQYGITSEANTLFTSEKKRWYPNGTKIIPKDFRFSPISMNIAYLGRRDITYK